MDIIEKIDNFLVEDQFSDRVDSIRSEIANIKKLLSQEKDPERRKKIRERLKAKQDASRALLARRPDEAPEENPNPPRGK